MNGQNDSGDIVPGKWKLTRISLVFLCMVLAFSILTSCSKPERPLTAEELLDLGEKYLLELDYEQALAQFLKIIELEPMNPRGYTGAADAYIGLGEYDNAISVIRSGLKLLRDDESFLRDAAAILERIINKAPEIADTYIDTAEIYFNLGDGERSIDAFRRGMKRLPDNERIATAYYVELIPEYTITQTLYQEICANDGVLLARNEYWQPVFVGNSNRVRKMNEAFSNDLADVNLDDFTYLPEFYDNREGYIYEDANKFGRVGGYLSEWEESWRKNQYISFAEYGEWDNLGVHGGMHRDGHTFDVESGKLLAITDILKITSSNIKEVLYNEYIAYHASLGDGFDEMARGDGSDSFSSIQVDAVKSQCGEDAIFWLSDDGVHIFFDEYTFSFADGATELLIPYDRSDLLRTPFALNSSDDVNETAVAGADWKQAYMDTIMNNQTYAGSADWETHDHYGDYPMYITGFQLADLNFDGVPELLSYGDGAGASATMRIFTMIENGAKKVFQGWGDIDTIELYRGNSNDSLAYFFTSANGEYDYYGGAVYRTDSHTVIDASFEDNAKYMEFSAKDEFSYDQDTYVETLISTTYTIDGRVVSRDEYDRLQDGVYSGYNKVNRNSTVLWWDYDSALTVGDYTRFLESYVPER